MLLKPSVTSVTEYKSQKHPLLVRAQLGSTGVPAHPTHRHTKSKWVTHKWGCSQPLTISIFHSPQKTSIHHPKSISHELLNSQDTGHEYACVCLEDKVVKQMGSTVAWSTPAHKPVRKWLESFYLGRWFEHGFSAQEMVGKLGFLVDILLLFFQAYLSGITC